MARQNQPEPSPSTARGRLAALSEKKPHSKARQLRSLWPEIKAALDNGHTLKAVCECLEADGLRMSIYTLGSYVARMRRTSDHASSVPAPVQTPPSVGLGIESLRGTNDRSNPSIADQNPTDPLANLRKSQSKRPAFNYHPELADPDKLI